MADSLRSPSAIQQALADKLKSQTGPIPAGTIHSANLVNDQLSLVGWKDGDPIPPDLGAKLATLRDEAIADMKDATYADPAVQEEVKKVIAKLGKSSIIKIEDLPPVQQRKVAKLLQDFKQEKELEAASAAEDEQIENELPAFIQGQDREVFKAAAKSANAAATDSQFEIEDDRDSINANELPKPVTYCECCAWPSDKPYVVEITPEDKELFLAAMLGVNRFVKKKEAYGGRLRLEFQTLTVYEYRQIMNQLSVNTREGISKGDAEYLSSMIDYRLVLCLQRATLQGNVIYEAPDFETWEKSAECREMPSEDWMIGAIPKFVERFYKIVTQVPLRVVMGSQFKDFERLVDTLSIRAADSNFW